MITRSSFAENNGTPQIGLTLAYTFNPFGPIAGRFSLMRSGPCRRSMYKMIQEVVLIRARSRRCYKEPQVRWELVEINLFFSSHSQNTKPTYSHPKRNNSERETCKLHKLQSMCSSYRSAAAVHEFTHATLKPEPILRYSIQ